MHVDTDDHCDWYRCAHGRRRPGTVLHGVHDDQAQNGNENDHDRHDPQHGGIPSNHTQFIPGHLAQRPPVTAKRTEENHHILNTATNDGANQNPEGSREITKLSSEGRTDQGTWTCDRRKVVTKHNPTVGGEEVPAIIEAYGRRQFLGIQHKDFCRDEMRIETVADGVDTKGCRHKPETIDRLSALESDGAHR